MLQPSRRRLQLSPTRPLLATPDGWVIEPSARCRPTIDDGADGVRSVGFMSIAREIDATVAAFVVDLALLVRRVAEETVQDALEELGRSSTTARRASTPRRPRPARAPKAAPATTSAKPPVFAKPVAAPPSSPLAPPVAVRRIPPKRRRVAKAAPPPPPPIEPRTSEPVPAKRWVVVRRPARPRHDVAPGGPAPAPTAATTESTPTALPVGTLAPA
jgi:hypothetical protein